MDDIGQILYERVKKDFDDIQSKKDNSDYIQKILDKVDNKTATMREVETFSQALGSKLSSLLRDSIKLEDMPDGKVYYNIADKILTPLLRENYELVNEIAGRVQRKLDEEQGIHIEPQKAPFPAERVNRIVNAVSAAETQEQLNRRLTSPVENVTESFYTDYIKENAKFRSKAGLKCYIVRDTGGGCCEWCSAIAGKYEYPGDVPEDVYRRHDNCTCSVTYYSGKTAQDVWSKTTWNTSKSERAELKAKEQKILQSQKPTSEQLEVMKNIKADTGARVDNSGESGIIRENGEKPITPITDESINRVQKVEIEGFTDEQNEFIWQQHKELLTYAHENNNDKEVAFVFDKNLDRRLIFTGSDNKVEFGNLTIGSDLTVLHNHPRNSSYSLTDMGFFGACDNLKRLSIVTNTGRVEVITKSENFKRDIFSTEYNRIKIKVDKANNKNDKEKIIQKWLKKTKSGVILDERS